jgi:hypothetical protein
MIRIRLAWSTERALAPLPSSVLRLRRDVSLASSKKVLLEYFKLHDGRTFFGILQPNKGIDRRAPNITQLWSYKQWLMDK